LSLSNQANKFIFVIHNRELKMRKNIIKFFFNYTIRVLLSKKV
jgi:hypothetical protein